MKRTIVGGLATAALLTLTTPAQAIVATPPPIGVCQDEVARKLLPQCWAAGSRIEGPPPQRPMRRGR